ncbi:pyridoxamine 5'-phosphate oxidase family protein [Arthrobacter halodurans]|uniref:Pyridoxamine 5'-phosphate oxidase family protein n=1 Tax=Arthrobacter halodurans TaxID=516699 RepID=A0ABV4UP32_9MICC
MMFSHADDNPVLVLDAEQCWRLLDHSKHGRIALSVGGEVDIVPVNYAAADGKIYLRTGPGTKLAELTVNPKVAFEADGILSEEAWSVVIRGRARSLETEAEIATARGAGVVPWVPTVKESWVEIVPAQITGRHFQLGPQPEMFDEY